MTLIEHDHMIEQVPAAVTDPAFGDPVLPRTSEAGSLRFDAHALNRAYNFLIEVRRPIENQKLWRRVVGECFAQLLRDRGAAWVAGDVPMQNPSPVMRYDEEAIQHTKGLRRMRRAVD